MDSRLAGPFDAASRGELAAVLAELRGADEGTAFVLAKLRRDGVTRATFLAAVVELEKRRREGPPIANEAAWYVDAVKRIAGAAR